MSRLVTDRKCKSNGNCGNPVFIILKVQIWHPDSLRKSWQTWYMCQDCFLRFKEAPFDWYCKYSDKTTII